MPLRLLLPDSRIVAASELPKAGEPGDREKRTRDQLSLLNREREKARRRRELERLNAKR